MNTIVPRFEFRVFARCLGLAEQRLRAMAPCDTISESREIYLLPQEDICDRNIKIRDGRLEVKRIIDRQGGLERWQPDGHWGFPVARETLRHAHSSGDMLARLQLLPATLSREALLRAVARRSLPLYRANVWKRRFRFSPAGCRAELDQLLVNGAAVESLAVESENPQAVLEVRAALRLEDCENQSYPLALSRILGLTSLPGEEDYG
jgi:hypothetical protein